MKLTLYIWRQKDANSKGEMVKYEHDGVDPDMSFLEMLDTLNERLILEGKDPIAFDHDCPRRYLRGLLPYYQRYPSRA